MYSSSSTVYSNGGLLQGVFFLWLSGFYPIQTKSQKRAEGLRVGLKKEIDEGL